MEYKLMHFSMKMSFKFTIVISMFYHTINLLADHVLLLGAK